MPAQEKRPRQWLARVGWLLLFWIGGVAALAAVSYALKVVMRLAQLTP